MAIAKDDSSVAEKEINVTIEESLSFSPAGKYKPKPTYDRKQKGIEKNRENKKNSPSVE